MAAFVVERHVERSSRAEALKANVPKDPFVTGIGEAAFRGKDGTVPGVDPDSDTSAVGAETLAEERSQERDGFLEARGESELGEPEARDDAPSPSPRTAQAEREVGRLFGGLIGVLELGAPEAGVEEDPAGKDRRLPVGGGRSPRSSSSSILSARPRTLRMMNCPVPLPPWIPVKPPPTRYSNGFLSTM
jgi:hypothetical protein